MVWKLRVFFLNLSSKAHGLMSVGHRVVEMPVMTKSSVSNYKWWVWEPQGHTIEILIHDNCCSEVVSSVFEFPEAVALDKVEGSRQWGYLPVSEISWEIKVLSSVIRLLPAGVRIPCNHLSLIGGRVIFSLISWSTAHRTQRQHDNMWVAKVPNGPSLWTSCFHTLWAGNASPLQGQMPKIPFSANSVNKHLLIAYWVQSAK